MTYSVVWFKRDLRVHDHVPLTQALARGPVLCLYVIEPSMWAQPDAAHQHHAFLQESLIDLNQQLQVRSMTLQVAVGEVPEILTRLHALQPFEAIFSHEETGNGATYTRDKAVARWCRAQGVTWREMAQHGVVRRLANRDLWHAHWRAHMGAPCEAAPDTEPTAPQRCMTLPWPADAWPSAQALGLGAHLPPARQHGGRKQGLRVLRDFLQDRSVHYRGGISSPLTAPTACSRLSPYLAMGCLGMREVVQATQRRLHHLGGSTEPEAVWQRKGLTAFMSRLHWHCHFIQKLESEPELEWRNLHRGYNDLREPDWNDAHFEALVVGRTGWPMVDACVAMLRETGWINFRMRAMLVSVASYPLWLHWRPVGLWLAQQFIDYEPGIHWSQMQMQAGTTGINTTRVYNPIKQAQDHDPHGHFVRRWLPAMRRVPDTWLMEPWRMPPDVQARCGVRVGHDIAMPLIDLDQATGTAKDRVHALRAQGPVRAAKAAIVQKHGSRQHRAGGTRRHAVHADPQVAPQQQTFDF